MQVPSRIDKGIAYHLESRNFVAIFSVAPRSDSGNYCIQSSEQYALTKYISGVLPRSLPVSIRRCNSCTFCEILWHVPTEMLNIGKTASARCTGEAFIPRGGHHKLSYPGCYSGRSASDDLRAGVSVFCELHILHALPVWYWLLAPNLKKSKGILWQSLESVWWWKIGK